MIKINSDEFHHMEKTGNFVFTSNDCFLCREYMRELKKNNVDTSSWYLVNVSDDIEFYSWHYLASMPVTRVYKENVIMHEQGGVLYRKQLKIVTDYKHG